MRFEGIDMYATHLPRNSNLNPSGLVAKDDRNSSSHLWAEITPATHHAPLAGIQDWI